MRGKVEIIPHILEREIKEVRRKLGLVKPYVETVAVDIIDGIFVSNKTHEVLELKGLKELEGLKLDFHLMVSEPTLFVDDCKRAGGNRVIGQIEMMNDQEEFVKLVKSNGMSAGLALDLETPVEAIEERLLGEIDCVLVMSVKAGASGQGFQREALDKIRKLRGLAKKHGEFNIAVDGGINKETIKEVTVAGANHLGVTSAIFKAEDMGKAIKELMRLVK